MKYQNQRSWGTEQMIGQKGAFESGTRFLGFSCFFLPHSGRAESTDRGSRQSLTSRGRCKLVNHCHCAFVFNDHLQRKDKKDCEFVATETIQVQICTCQRAHTRMPFRKYSNEAKQYKNEVAQQSVDQRLKRFS